ncbi:double-strand break repair helicase AddA [Allosphingosinicella deserti]|uniref:DNA 3'-5' helicase n=1 Tax=Allosphingosinicella deserti TaxID=2116704 RepID=A0A2P7QGZ4_9SPHN|nr:double-strand break repair helicase AddA [Sphingomonas deserti]PSJ37254.1 double-strand break repair helicase AddA [Sphingomonas deserti]
MSRRLRPLNQLKDEQQLASSPRDHAALSASAGTGKTHVLTARVLRLLLSGVDPSSILCLTFTKAGAAEMADRIHERLAYWVRLETTELRRELFALGEPTDDPSVARARTLFARVLDAAGGGLRIQTIHAFSQSLLAAFPTEAGLVPGFRPLDGREEQLLARQTLAEMLVRAEEGSDLPLIRDVQALSHRLGEAGAEAFLRACARAQAPIEALGAREGIEAKLRRVFDLPAGDIDAALADGCCDDAFDVRSLERIADANRLWGTATGLSCCDVISAWRGRGNPARADTLEELAALVLTKSGDPRKVTAGLAKVDPNYTEHAGRLAECCRALLQMRRTAGLVACLAAGLRAGQTFALAYGAAKRAAGAVDFDDLIRRAEALLLTPGISEWVRYKLDQATDHILVDEAQDTNERQWNIVRALTLEFFAGESASQRPRTIFTVGDYKQAIFGFQGTDPQAFEVARAWFAGEAGAVDRDFLDLSMDRSFRSSPEILAVVDRVIEELGHGALGLPRAPNPHVAHHASRPGSVTLWAPFTGDGGEPEDEAGEEGWVSDTVRVYAGRIARQIRLWLDDPFFVASKARPLRPEDILVLVRRRGDLASLIVARLHAEGVPVAGVDRLLLTAPLAVQDLLAAARFAMQPLDDLNLASLLVSPLFGWTQDDLYAAAIGREGGLWPRLRTLADRPSQLAEGFRDRLAETMRGLSDILSMADYATPHQFLETILSGPSGSRRKLLERLGPEARDPIEELLASALEFEANSAPSLQRFLEWFARGDVEIVRDPSAPLDAVRVMTVHGSKGLQSPVLILADACADPDRKGGGIGGSFTSLTLAEEDIEVPIFRPRKDELVEPLASDIAAIDAAERREHWRLLYVALTRAEERLYVGGALGPMAKGAPPLASWYRAIETALSTLGGGWEEDMLWGRSLRHGPLPKPASADPRRVPAAVALPEWIRRSAPLEARPPRPLAPSALGEDDVSDPPPSPALRDAAARGRLLHQLFERLPDVPPAERATRAERWLQQAAGVGDAALRQSLVEDACRVISDPRHAELFGPEALAEAPIAAVVADGLVVSGTVDRLLVQPGRVVVADFKTGRRAPTSRDAIPVPHLRQMAAYAEALRVIFPGRRIEAKLLYTSVPMLHDLPDELLARYLPQAA